MDFKQFISEAPAAVVAGVAIAQHRGFANQFACRSGGCGIQ